MSHEIYVTIYVTQRIGNIICHTDNINDTTGKQKDEVSTTAYVTIYVTKTICHRICHIMYMSQYMSHNNTTKGHNYLRDS
jgi:hypothetical protein